ncbi:MAG TPA: hypothetical protein VGE74_23775 [Gemmata sp.]
MKFALYRALLVALLATALAAGATAQPPSTLNKLKADTAALAAERAAAESNSTERAKLADDLRRLMDRLDKEPRTTPMPPPVTPNTGAPKKDPHGGGLSSGVPVDRLRAAMNLVRDNQIESALNAFRLLDMQQLSPDDRAFAKFMTASCLRRLGRTAEAMPIYREVGDAGEDPFISSSAVSQLALMRTAEELQAQLAKLRERPKTRP